MADDSLLIQRYPGLKHFPNYLTLIRIAFIPVMVVLMWILDRESPLTPTGWNQQISFVTAFLFGITFLTDFVDGYLARKWEVESTMGAFLDPLADKLLILATLVMLVELGRAPAWVVIIILGREIAGTGLRSIASSRGIVIPASGLGKYKTIFQVIAILGLLVYYQYPYEYNGEELTVTYGAIGTVFLYVALAFTVWSGWEYFAEFWAAAAEQDRSDDPLPPSDTDSSP